MYLWHCKYCNELYTSSKTCVFHEINECIQNPKFHYLQEENNNDINYNESHSSYKKCLEQNVKDTSIIKQ